MGRYYDDRFIAFGIKSENANGKFPSYFLDIEGAEMMRVDADGVGLEGTVTADTIKTDTLIAELFKKDETQVMKSKFLFSDGSRTTAGYESGSLELKVKEQAFQAGDWVEVSWANGTGFGNQIVHIDKKLTDPERYSFDTYIDPFSSWPEDATVARIAGTGVGRGNYIYLNGAATTITGYENVEDYDHSPFGTLTKDFKWELRPDGVYAENGRFRGEIHANSGTIDGILSMSSASSIVMGDPAAGGSFHLGDFNLNSSAGSAHSFGGTVSTINSQSGTTTQDSDIDTYAINLNSNYSFSIDVDYTSTVTRNSGNNTTGAPTGWYVVIELDFFDGDPASGATNLKHLEKQDNSIVSKSGTLFFDTIPPDGTSYVRLTRTVTASMGENEERFQSIKIESSSNEQAIWDSSQDFIGPGGIKYTENGEVVFQLNTTNSSNDSSYANEPRLQVRNGRLVMLDASGDPSISLDPRGAIVFHQASSTHYDITDLGDYGFNAAAILFVKNQGGG